MSNNSHAITRVVFISAKCCISALVSELPAA